MSTRRCVTQFKKDGAEEFVRDYDLRGVRTIQLQRMFGAGADDSRMVLCYPVTEKQRPAIEQLLGESLNLRKYDYFVEAYADAKSASGRRSAAVSSRRVAARGSRPAVAARRGRSATSNL